MTSGEERPAEELAGPFLPSHLYVHVPFCRSKCDYCDFYSIPGRPDELVEPVFRGIRSQLVGWSNSGLQGVIDTIYFGGGTPSCVPEKVVETLDFVREHFVVHRAAEITVEGNPDSLGDETVTNFAEAGVTRVSVGVQSFDDHVLSMLGRRHDAEAAWSAARRVVASGMALSVDLMCGVPGQSATSWERTLERACMSGARHASVYPLSVEEKTPLDVAISAGLVPDTDADTQAEMMLLAEGLLGNCGLSRYEVANYASSVSDQSRHNKAYWTGSSYIGVGPAAHGMVGAATGRVMGLCGQDACAARVRYGNAASVEEWLVGRGDSCEQLCATEAEREDVMLGLRLTSGVEVEQVRSAGLSDVLESLASEGLCELVDDRWRTTTRGWLLGNEVFGRVWSGEP
ncbi:MAG TPA: coproporphyrinogen-III oxidase family protein [Coriobacteriia bacterium]|nr:coproporphyrinogen-III oxidase family protein [Coriobacteriia bacterium]